MKDKPSLEVLMAEAANIDTALGRLDELARRPELTAIVAANPATSGETLARLASGSDRGVRQAVAHNPNTPVEHLLRLAPDFPLEFLSNPVLPLLNLSQPDFIKNLPTNGWVQLLRVDRVPPIWLKWLRQGVILPYPWQRREVEQELLLHIAIAGEASSGWEKLATRALYQDPRLFNYLRRTNAQLFLLCLLAFPNLAALWDGDLRSASLEVQRSVLKYGAELDGHVLSLLARDPDTSIRCLVARHPQAPAKVLAKLADRDRPAVRCAVACNAHLSTKLLRWLAGDTEASVRVAVAHHPRVPPEVLETLAIDADFTVRAAVARHPKLSLEIYQLLAEDFDATVRATLARNVHAPKETLLSLAQDARLEVRAAVARNPRLPAEAFALLFQETSIEVRCGLASNPSLPFSLLEQLAAEADPAVRRCLAANPRTPIGLLEFWLQEAIKPQSLPGLAQKLLPLPPPQNKSDKPLLLALARNPHAPPALLATLADYRSGKFNALTDLYAAVAAHKRTPVEALRNLAVHSSLAIQRSLAVNPHTPLDVLKRLLAVEDNELRTRIAHHPAVLRDQRRIVIDLLLEKVSQDKNSSLLPVWFFFQQGELPETRFPQLLTSAFWRDRYLVARHPKASQEILSALAHDGNRFVRAAARTALIKRALFKKRVQTKRLS